MSFLKVKNKLAQIKFVKDSLWTISAHIFVSIAGLVINTIIGVKFHADGLGIFSQSLSFYLLFSLIANLGIQTSAQKHAAQYSIESEKLKQIYSCSLFSTGISSILITTLIILILNVFPQFFSSVDVVQFLKILCLAIPVFSINKSQNNFLAGLRIFRIYSSVRVMRWVLILSGIVFISIINGELNNIAFLFVFSEIILFLFLVIKCNPYWTKPNWEWIRLHLSFGVKNIMAEFVSTLNTHFPILIIGYLSGNSAAGYFAYILFFARSILFIPGALQKNFNPVFTKYWYSGQLGEIKKRLYKVFKGCIISIIPAFLNLYVFFFIYTKYFMPTDYLDLSFILIILLVGVSTTYLFGPFSTLLIMAGELYSNLLRVALVAVTNLVLTVIFVLKFGYFGAAYAMSISLFIDVCLLDILYRRKLGIHFFHITIFQLIGIDDKNHK